MRSSAFSFSRINDAACRVLDAQGQHVGNLKLIHGVWKFKAIGYDGQGQIVPGGGPFTDRHNVTLDGLDVEQLREKLGG